MKRKNIFKSLLAAAMALIMIFGAAPLSGFVGIRLPMLSLKAEAATTDDGLFEYERDSQGAYFGMRITRYKGPDSGEVVIPKIIAGYEVKWIGYAAFRDCIGITSIVIPDSVISIAVSAFSGCTSLTEITVSPDNKNYSSVDGVLFNKDMSILVDYPAGNNRSTYTVPDGVTQIVDSAFSGCTSLSKVKLSNNLTIIEAGTFRGCTSLTEITIPDGVTVIRGGWYDYDSHNGAFSGCTSLKEIVIPDSVTGIGESAFFGCQSLKEITIPDSVMGIGEYAFEGCTSLAEIVIPDSVTEIGWSAFSGCTSLSKVKLPNSLTKIGDYAFYYCKNLTEITIPDSVTEISWSAFEGCTSLAEITIPDSVTSIGEYAFSGCTSLSEITVSPDNKNYSSVDGVLFNKDGSELIVYPKGNKRSTYTVPDGVTKIEYGAFCDCTSLAEITIPGSVTEIGESAFSGCTSLKKITIPDSVTKIKDFAFKNCSTIKIVCYLGTRAQWQEIIIGADNEALTNATIHCIDDPHIWGKWEVIEEVTYEKDGLERRTCSLCDIEETRVIPKLVRASAIELSESEKTVFVGDTFTITATVKPEDAFNRTVTWSSSDPSIATVDENGTVTAIAKGEAIITAESADRVKAECKVTVEKKVAAIELSESEKTVFVGDTFTITATVKPEDAFNRTVTWSSSDPSIATVDENGTVTAIAKGEAIITAESADGVKAECKVTVEKKVSAIELSESEKTVFVCDTFTITATVKPEDAFNRTVTWSSSDPSIATVDENGTVTAIAKGEAIITAESADGVKAECKVTVEKKVAAIELSESEKTVFVGDTFTITATVKPEDAFNRTVTWSSSDPSIATVDENGTVTAIAKGEAIITAESADGVKAECKVTVEKKVAAIELSESEKTVFVGDTFTITATVKPEDAFNRTVTWSSSDPSIATVDENGTVTAIAKGEAIITAESADGVKAECKVTVEKKDGFFKTLLKIITAPFRAIIYLFKKLFGK